MFCVQETHLRPNHANFLKQFVVFRKDRDNRLASSGGVAIITDKSDACEHLNIHTSLEAVAIRAILFNMLVTVFSLHIPPNHILTRFEFENLIDQLEEPYIILGDMNAPNPLWSDPRCDSRGVSYKIFLFQQVRVFSTKKNLHFIVQHTIHFLQLILL